MCVADHLHRVVGVVRAAVDRAGDVGHERLQPRLVSAQRDLPQAGPDARAAARRARTERSGSRPRLRARPPRAARRRSASRTRMNCGAASSDAPGRRGTEPCRRGAASPTRRRRVAPARGREPRAPRLPSASRSDRGTAALAARRRPRRRRRPSRRSGSSHRTPDECIGCRLDTRTSERRTSVLRVSDNRVWE